MCGINAIISKTEKGLADFTEILELNNTLKHRGPDSEGFAAFQNHEIKTFFGKDTQPACINNQFHFSAKKSITELNEPSTFVLGHRRLSIIDLTPSGHQPMCDNSKAFWITYNGELYNYLELKEELKSLGHIFITNSDTEVIIASYKAWGGDCVKRFNGMFAFVLFDQIKKCFFIARDITGVKPLYYYENNDVMYFSSEQKALLKINTIPKIANQKSIYKHLVFNKQGSNANGEELTFFENIIAFPKGHYMLYDLSNHKKKVIKYFNINEEINNAINKYSEKDIEALIFEKIKTAIDIRLRSDVEIGVCLSGGIDSSVIACMIDNIKQAQQQNKPTQLFTITFPNQKEDESIYAAAVVDKTNGVWHTYTPTKENFAKDIDDLVYSQDIPIISTSTYAQWCVMRLVKEHQIKVVLNGHGADELFGGYPPHWISYWNEIDNKQKKEEQKNTTFFIDPKKYEWKQKIKQSQYNIWKKYFSNEKYLDRDFIQQFKTEEKELFYFDNLNQHLQTDYFGNILSAYLKYEDRCGMWHSVESRLPFADDKELMILLFSINGQLKLKNSVLKNLLRESTKTILPEKIYSRRDKKGFESPNEDFLQQIMANNLQFDNNLKSYLNNPFFEQNINNQKINTSFLTKAMFFNKWLGIFMK
jgi:asparagine synthase (glutamine-hydrolysing)